MPNASIGIGMNFNRGGIAPRRAQPFRILVLADFSAHSRNSVTPLGLVTANNYGDICQRIALTLDLDVDNHLDPRAPASLRVRVPIADLSDFTPAGVIANVTELTTLYLFRERLQLYLRKEIGVEEFLAGLDAYAFAPALVPHVKRCRGAAQHRDAPVPRATPTPQPPRRTDVDRILDLVASTQAEPAASEPPRTAADAVAASLGAARSGTVAGATDIAESAREITQLLNRQISAILHHPQFVEAESAWRGLRFLLEHGADGAVELEVIDTPRSALDAALEHRLTARGMESGVAPSLVVMDFEFGPESADVALLQRVGTMAQDAQVPCLFSAAQSFFGHIPESARPLPYLGSVMDQVRYSAWNSLRAKECARWLCGGFNRFVLRETYNPENTRGLDITETGATAGTLPWGRAAWLISALVARSVNETHWPTQITGMQRGQLSQLQLLGVASEHSSVAFIPLQSMLTMQNAEDIAQCGLAPLVCQPNRDSAYLLYAPTLRRAQPGSRATEYDIVSLPYQLFVAHITETLRADHTLWSGELTARDTASQLQRTLDDLLADTGPNHVAHVQLTPDPDGKARSLLQLDLHAGRDILNGATVQLTLPV